MIRFHEMSRSLAAALRLLGHDRSALSAFNNTASGFWHSFFAIALIAPLYLLIASINWAPDAAQTNSATGSFSLLKNLAILSLQWVLWPLVMVFVTRWLGLGQHFSRYVIVYNWSNVLIITGLAVPALLFKFNLMPLEAALMLTGLLQLFTFYLEWYLTRLSLEASGLIAGAVVLGNFVLSAGIVRIAG